MSDKITKRTSQDKEFLRNKTVYAVPDNPSDKGFSASQIKSKIADPSLILFDWLKILSDETSDALAYYDEHIDEIVAEAADKLYADGFIENHQATATVIINALTNLNGRTISAFTATLHDEYWNAYPNYEITENGEKLTVERAKDYMEYMTGSRFLPTYDYERPKNSMWVMADGSFWKPQYDDTNGMRLYLIPNPFQLVSNKVSSWQITPTDIAYPTEKLVWDTFQTQKEEINGKSRSLVLSYLKTAPTTDVAAQELKKPDGTAFDDLADFNDYVSGYTLGNGGFDTSSNIIIWFDFQPYYLIDVEGIVYLKTDLVTQFKTGDNVYITELQSSSVTNLPDRWMKMSGGQISFYQLETAKVDLSSYVDLSSAQTITGVKTFTEDMKFNDGTYTWKIEENATSHVLRFINPYNNIAIEIPYNLDGIKIGQLLKLTTNGFQIVDNAASPHTWKMDVDSDWYLRFTCNGSTLFYANPAGTLFTRNIEPIGSFDAGTQSHPYINAWINNLKGVTTLTQAQYDAITPDADTLYFIEEE